VKKRFLSFLVLLLIFALFAPSNAFAQSAEKVPTDLEISEELLNGNEPFSFIQNENDEDTISSRAASGLAVTLTKRSGLLEGNWVFSTNSPITYANLSFYI